MTPAEWEEVAAEVLEGIVEAGTGGFVVAPGTKTGPEDNPTVGSPTVYPCLLVYSKWNSREIDGTLIVRGDQKILMAAEGFAPDVDWTFRETAGGPDKQIVPPLTVVKPGGVPVLYVLNVRG